VIRLSLKVVGRVGVISLVGVVGMLRLMGHRAEVVVFGLGQVVVETPSNVHRKNHSVGRLIDLEVFIVVCWCGRRGSGRSWRRWMMLSIVFLPLFFFLCSMMLFLLSLLSFMM